MANFSSHIQEIREIIAASSATTSTSAPASAHFEAKLRAVLPILVRNYVLPSPTGSLPLLSPSPPMVPFISHGWPRGGSLG